MNINMISPISFGKRIRLANEEEAAKLEHASNAALGMSMLTSATTSGMDVLSASGVLMGLPSSPVGLLGSSLVSPGLAMDASSKAPALFAVTLGAESVAAPILGKVSYDIIEKEFPSDEEDDNVQNNNLDING